MKLETRTIVRAAMFAAIYAALTLLLFPISYGPVQMRLSEALTVFAAVSPTAGVGLTLGCFVANLTGFLTGANPMPLDLLLGPLATALAALGSYLLRGIRYRGVPYLVWIPPVVVNALILGAEFTFLAVGAGESPLTAGVFVLKASLVAAGQLVPCLVLGIPLYMLMQKKFDMKKYF